MSVINTQSIFAQTDVVSKIDRKQQMEHKHFHKLSCIELDVNPKNATFQLIEEKDQLKLKCTLLLKMQWNSLKAKSANDFEKDPENNDFEKFAETHYPGVPQISGVNGNTDDGIEFDKENDVKIKKVLLTSRLVGNDADPDSAAQEIAHALTRLTKAYGGVFYVQKTGKVQVPKVKGYIRKKRGSGEETKVGTSREETEEGKIDIDVGRYQMTQLIKFQVPLSSMTSSTSADFPYDAYDIKLTFTMKPIQVLEFSPLDKGGNTANEGNNDAACYKYQLLFDFLKSSREYKDLDKPKLDKMTYKKENFYAMVTVKKWPIIASCLCKQEFQGFDIAPFSLVFDSPREAPSIRSTRSEK